MRLRNFALYRWWCCRQAEKLRENGMAASAIALLQNKLGIRGVEIFELWRNK
jgi:hypothetical protein